MESYAGCGNCAVTSVTLGLWILKAFNAENAEIRQEKTFEILGLPGVLGVRIGSAFGLRERLRSFFLSLPPNFAVKVGLELSGRLFGLGKEAAKGLRKFDGFPGAEDDQPEEQKE